MLTSIRFDINHSSGDVLKMLGSSADLPVALAAGSNTKTTDPSLALKSKSARLSRISGWITSRMTSDTGVKPPTEHTCAENQTVVGSKLHPSWPSMRFWDNLEDDERMESDDFSRPYPPKQNFGRKLKQKFAIMPLRDDRDYYWRPEKDRKIGNLRRALNGGLIAMKLKNDLNSQQNGDWTLQSLNANVAQNKSRRLKTVLQHWGSDGDLVRDLGIGVDPELRASSLISREELPIAVAGNVPILKTQKEDHWQLSVRQSNTMSATKLEKLTDIAGTEAAELAKRQQGKVSFFDVGGLLDESQSQVC
jgi:hypothetical protein